MTLQTYLYRCLLRTLPLWAVGGFTACQLEETPYSSIAVNQFYKTAEDAEAALQAVYGSVGDLYAGPAPLMVSDFSADQVYPRPVVGRDTYTLFSYDPEYSAARSFNRANESPLHIWQQCYSGIEKANLVIANVPAILMNPARRDQIVGEASFLRAFFYWTLTKNFGDVVLKTDPSTTEVTATAPQVPAAQVYEQIYRDLETAAASLPSGPAGIQAGRPSKEAALGLHAKAALYGENWQVALQKAQEVIGGGYSLLPDVRDVYNPDREAAARVENLFAFESDNTNPGRTSQIMGLYGPANGAAPAYGSATFGSIFAYPAFYASFDPADKRRQLLDTNYVNRTGQTVPQRSITPITPRGVLVKKYQDPASVGGNTRANIPILRLADVYLVAAEAAARLNGPTGQAYEYLNVVRRRAGLPDLAPDLDANAFLNAVLQERSWELFSEGDRWYDLTRTNTFLSVIPRAVNDVFPVRNPQPRHRYFPIPADEIAANPAVSQAPGWN
ncbi:MAG: RagB/SusD family nutrient uptake outer membrane protein [Cytophagales bacterium]|nr:RagB/SusD family nutrient uptake outer membrane protein [Cytophagales bacterium]